MRNELMSAATNPKVTYWMTPDGQPTQFDKRLLTDMKPDFVTYSSFEYEDPERLSGRTDVSDTGKALAAQYADFLAELKKSYDPEKAFGADAMAVQDMEYIQPRVLLYGSAKDHALVQEIEWFLFDHLRVERGRANTRSWLTTWTPEGAAKFFHGTWLTKLARNFLQALHLLRFEASLGPGIARTTAQRHMSALRSLLKFLKKNNEGPATDLPSTGGFRKAKTLPKALRPDQMEALLGLPDLSKPKGLRDRALMELIYGAGLRVSEAVELEMNYLELGGGDCAGLGKAWEDASRTSARRNSQLDQAIFARW